MKYIAKDGDDLWHISELFYGDAGLWDVIYYANVDIFGDDPEHIVHGTEIEIPPMPVGEVTVILSAVEMEIGELHLPYIDRLITVCYRRRGSIYHYFRTLQRNNLKGDEMPDTVTLPAIGSKKDVETAYRWRKKYGVD